MSTRIAMRLPTGTYSLDPAASRLTFTTRHMFGMGAVKGTFAASTATVRSDGGHTVVDATIAAGSFSSGDPKRDAKVVSATFLDVENHPLITFHAERVAATDDGLAVEGALIVRGRAANVTVSVTDVQDLGDDVEVTATAEVDRYALGVTAMKGMAARMLSFTITARFTRVS